MREESVGHGCDADRNLVETVGKLLRDLSGAVEASRSCRPRRGEHRARRIYDEEDLGIRPLALLLRRGEDRLRGGKSDETADGGDGGEQAGVSSARRLGEAKSGSYLAHSPTSRSIHAERHERGEGNERTDGREKGNLHQ
jgi:hypothetical protein